MLTSIGRMLNRPLTFDLVHSFLSAGAACHSSSRLLRQFPDFEPIKIGHAVRLDPKPDAPVCGPRLWCRIFCYVQRLVVEEDCEPVVARMQRERVPLSLLNPDRFGAGKLLALSVTDAVEPNVAFERIGTRYVVVASVDRAHDHTAGLVGLSRHRLAARCDLDIGGSDGLVHRNQKSEVHRT